MDYEQKYKDALERAKDMLSYKEVRKEDMEYLFPELKESEDERTRKDIISYLRNEKIVKRYISDIEFDKWIAWLEKQTEHLENYDDEDILQRFSFYSYKDEPNIIYLSGLYVNAKHRNKGIGTKILTIADEVAARMGCNVIRLKTEIGGNAERLYRRNGYNTFKRDGNQVWLEKQGEQNFDYEHADIPQKDSAPIEPKTIDADKVIEWLDENVADFWESPSIINQFKEDFGL